MGTNGMMSLLRGAVEDYGHLWHATEVRILQAFGHAGLEVILAN
jgi:hypothetical protein